MELSFSSEPGSRSDSQEFSEVLQIPKVYYLIYKSPPLVSVLSLTNLLHPISLGYNLTLHSHLRLGLLNGHFPSGFLTNILYAFLFSSHVLNVLPISSPSLHHSNYILQRAHIC
jgi:hypothetical protein